MATGIPALRYGTTPALWAGLALDEVLDQVELAGFAGVELPEDPATAVPADPAALAAALHDRGLRLAAACWRPGLTDGQGVVGALNAVNARLDYLKAAGGEVLVVAEPGVPERRRVAGRVSEAGARVLTDDAWQNLADGLNELGARCEARGLQLAFQPEAGSWVETANETKKLMNLVDAALVGLSLDTGHWLYGGGDPVNAVETWWRRLRYVRLRDVDLAVRETAVRHGLDLAEAQRRGVFPELARGSADLHDVASAIRASGYAGWVTAAQETTRLAPHEAARENRRALSVLFEKAPEEA